MLRIVKKIFFIFMFTLAGCAIVAGANPRVSYAYTKEQIAQAKAWLSAHGYAPTRSGAEQAYADYKAGKWNDKGEAVDQSTKDTEESQKSKSKETTKSSTSPENGEEAMAMMKDILEGVSDTTKKKETTTEATTEALTKEEIAKQKEATKKRQEKEAKQKRQQRMIYVGVGVVGVVFLVALYMVLKGRQ